MDQMEIISKVDEGTEWCAGVVVIPKANGKVRICVDLTKLNESILREYHPLPSVDHTLAHQLAGATISVNLMPIQDSGKSACHQSQLKSPPSSRHFGKFCIKRLPFGISSAPEHFQKRILQVLEGTDGALCQMDDILGYGKSVGEHNQANLTLNEELKCEFSKPSVEFLGTLIDSEGVHVSPKKVEAILKMKTPQHQTEC